MGRGVLGEVIFLPSHRCFIWLNKYPLVFIKPHWNFWCLEESQKEGKTKGKSWKKFQSQPVQCWVTGYWKPTLCEWLRTPRDGRRGDRLTKHLLQACLPSAGNFGLLHQRGSPRLERTGRWHRVMLRIRVLCSSVPSAFLLLLGDCYTSLCLLPLRFLCSKHGCSPGGARWAPALAKWCWCLGANPDIGALTCPMRHPWVFHLTASKWCQKCTGLLFQPKCRDFKRLTDFLL